MHIHILIHTRIHVHVLIHIHTSTHTHTHTSFHANSVEGLGGEVVDYDFAHEDEHGGDWDGVSRSSHTGVPWIHQTNQTGSAESSPVPLSVIWHDAATEL